MLVLYFRVSLLLFGYAQNVCMQHRTFPRAITMAVFIELFFLHLIKGAFLFKLSALYNQFITEVLLLNN